MSNSQVADFINFLFCVDSASSQLLGENSPFVFRNKDYLIEISRTKVKYFIISIRMGKSQKTQVLEFYFKQGKKLIKSAGGIEALADRIEFKYGSLSIQDQNKLLYQSNDQRRSVRGKAVLLTIRSRD